MVTVVQGKVCAKNHPDRLSRLATIHQRYRRTDGRTDFLWHRPRPNGRPTRPNGRPKIGFPVLDIFLSDWYHYQCMGHISVVTTAESCYSVKIGAPRLRESETITSSSSSSLISSSRSHRHLWWHVVLETFYGRR